MLQRSKSFLQFVNGDMQEVSDAITQYRVKRNGPVDDPHDTPAESVEEPPAKKVRLEIGEDSALTSQANRSRLPDLPCGSELIPNAPSNANQKCSMCQNQYQSVYRCSVWVRVPGQRKQNVWKYYCDVCWHFMALGHELTKNFHLAPNRVRHHALQHLVRAKQIMRKEAERQELIDDNRFPEEESQPQSLTLDAD